jgi:superfamily I DNA/RNA helicase/mRNA-degrading endonuclease YafQ of YafQ-DinJ toxin-antitoxin module
MAVDILATEAFDQALKQLSESMRKTVSSKILLLAENPAHPSLNVHRLQQIKGADIWDCYISMNMRLLYEMKDGALRLWDLGSHSIVDHAHLRGFAAHTRFSRMEMPSSNLPATEQTPAAQSDDHPLPYHSNTIQLEKLVPVSQGTPNRFAYFQTAHLRVLGVPAHLIQPLKNAPSLEKALNLPGLPERTRLWLEELSTSPELEEVMFDSSRLLFRTTLDRFEGYCEGKIKRLMLNLQRPEQQQYVDMERAPLILLKGAAGSGKTTVGIYRAIRLAEQGRRVLVLTYNRTLSSVTKSLLEELIGPLPGNLQVATLYQFLSKILRGRFVDLRVPEPERYHQVMNGFLDQALAEVRRKSNDPVLQRERDFFAEEIRRVIKGLGLQSVEEYKGVERYGRKTALSSRKREVVWRVYEAYQRCLANSAYRDWQDVTLLTMRILQEKPPVTPFDDIIVDEAQDLLPIDLRLIQQFVVPSSPGSTARSSVMILADAAQTLYSRGFSWKQAGIEARGRTAILRKNFRNTRQIAEAAAHLLAHNTLMRSSNEYVDPEWTQHQGAFPIVIRAGGAYNQVELMRDLILDLVADQTFRLSDFAVLCPTNALCEQCKGELDRAGLRTVYHRDSDFDLLEERVKILTIHSAKGLEFPVVFLLGLTSGTLPSTQGLRNAEPEEAQLFIEQQRTICYVGMTRAAEALYLLTVKGLESRFISELGDKVVQWQ